MSSSTNPRIHDEDDDLDDLDDIVEQFDSSPSKPQQPPAPPPTAVTATTTTSSAPAPTNPSLPTDEDLPEDFAVQLAEGMEKLMLELGGAPSGSGDGTAADRERQQAFEKMLIEGMNGVDLGNLGEEAFPSAAGGTVKAGAGATTPGAQDEDAFQRSIRQAMEKLKDSDSTLKSDASAAASSSDPLEALLSQLGTGLESAGDSDEELQGMLETMMQQLMSKEVLYEPLKELHDKFPAYLSENAKTISAEDNARYANQVDRVSKILAVFEDPSYSDDNQEKNSKIVVLMNEMQSFGSPPTAIMGDLPPGFDFGADGMPKMPEGCVIV